MHQENLVLIDSPNLQNLVYFSHNKGRSNNQIQNNRDEGILLGVIYK